MTGAEIAAVAIPAVAGGIASSAKGPAPSPLGGQAGGGGGGYQPTALRFSDLMGGGGVSGAAPSMGLGGGMMAPGTDEGLRLAMLLRQFQGA